MKVRTKDGHHHGHSYEFNTHAVSEVIVLFHDGDRDTMFISELDVLIGNTWKPLSEAFRDRDLVPNNLNTYFGEPVNADARERGYND